MKFSVEELQQIQTLVEYNASTGILSWRGPLYGTRKRIIGNKDQKGYLSFHYKGRNVRVHTLVWWLAHRVWVEPLDHINRNKSDNRLENLRPTTPTLNGHNRNLSKNSTSGCRGISFHKPSGKWASYMTVQYKRTHLGLFTSKEAAKQARDIFQAHAIHGLEATQLESVANVQP